MALMARMTMSTARLSFFSKCAVGVKNCMCAQSSSSRPSFATSKSSTSDVMGALGRSAEMSTDGSETLVTGTELRTGLLLSLRCVSC